MSIIFVLLPISLFLALLALGAYCWNVKSGQMDDLDSPALRMLPEDEIYQEKSEINKANTED